MILGTREPLHYCLPAVWPQTRPSLRLLPLLKKEANILFSLPTEFLWGWNVWFFFLTSLLDYNCFTMVCQFLLYNKVNQLYIYVCSHISSLLHLPPSNPPYPTPLGGHKAPSWSPCAMQLLPTKTCRFMWTFFANWKTPLRHMTLNSWL